MTPSKRIFDLVWAVIISLICLPLFLIISLLILIFDGRPIFYIAERMKTATEPFSLIKFRTMKTTGERNTGVSGGDKNSRVTKIGLFLRKIRLDEIPQLVNVLKGDMSFVGPRPPLRQYTEAFPELYNEVLQSRPGITGLASIHFHKHEEMLLQDCKTLEETNDVYSRRCIPRKARLDLLYRQHQNVCFDFQLALRTLIRVLN